MSVLPNSKSKASAAQRLQKELMELMMSAVDGITAFPDNDNLFQWIATLQGAGGTAYEGLEYQLLLKFSSNYPFEPPTVTFTTPCFHPNVDSHGTICLDILKENWSAVYTATNILLSIQSLLCNPNNYSPLNNQAASLWRDQVEYRRAVQLAHESGTAAAAAAVAAVTR